MKKKEKTGGRPKGDRPLKKISISVFQDTLPASSSEFRVALDFWREANRRTFSETFSPIPPTRELED